MSKVSFTEIKQSQLPYLNIVDGQIICCTDSGNIYKDNGTKGNN